MTDVLTPEQRRLNMSRVRGRDTVPEMRVRRGLHQLGFRYRVHAKELPGRPDLVLPRYRTAVLVHGCFWHGHGCRMTKMPVTRAEFWQQKIEGNIARDKTAIEGLRKTGWRTLVIWECALRGPTRLEEQDVFRRTAHFIRGYEPGHLEIHGVLGPGCGLKPHNLVKAD